MHTVFYNCIAILIEGIAESKANRNHGSWNMFLRYSLNGFCSQHASVWCVIDWLSDKLAETEGGRYCYLDSQLTAAC